jgi:hypothetical protein
VRLTEQNEQRPPVEMRLYVVFVGMLRASWRCARGGSGGTPYVSMVAAACAVAGALLMATPALAAEPPTFTGVAVKAHPTRVELHLIQALVPGGEETYMSECTIEYATSEAGPFTLVSHEASSGRPSSCGPSALVGHLTPETTYYARFFAKTANGGSATETRRFTTPSPSAPEFVTGAGEETRDLEGEELRLGPVSISKANVAASFLSAKIAANGAETTYRFEYATIEAGPYTLFPSGGTGKVTVAEEAASPKASLTEMTPETTYYIRVIAENGQGKISEVLRYKTPSDKPNIAAVEAAKLSSTSASLQGRLKVDGFGAQWRLEYAAGKDGPWIAVSEGAVSEAEVEADEAREDQVVVGPVELSGLSPGTTYYARMDVENANGSETGSEATPAALVSFKTPGPPFVTTFAVHGLEGETTIRLLGQMKSGFTADSGEGYQARYRLEYVSQTQFEANGWASATSAPEATLEEGYITNPTVEATSIVSQALSGLAPGEIYHYRFVASNTTAGNPVVVGNEETLRVPAAAPSGEQAPCPNEAFRVGPSARLPDCRAYEQVTPVEKGGVQDAFSYTPLGLVGYLVGADGEHLYLHDPGVKWGSSVGGVQNDYFFSRTADGWKMTSAKPVGEPGPGDLRALVFNRDLTQVGFSETWGTAPGIESHAVEFKVGQPGGPYQLVASVPISEQAELVGESEDGGKYVLESTDRTLTGPATGTVSGNDLYEFSEGKLRQMNVLGGSPGTPISTCGAAMPAYKETLPHYEESGTLTRKEEGSGTGEARRSEDTSPLTDKRVVENAVSADGSRVFFTDNCTHHLYMRVSGAETVDIGAYTLLSADPEGTTLVLENRAGEVLGYDVAAGKTVAPSAAERGSEQELLDLGIPIRRTPEAADPFAHSRDSYFVGDVTGLHYWPAEQAYRYDSAEQVVECVSCASPFDPTPKFRSFFGGTNSLVYNNGNYGETEGSSSAGEAAEVPFGSVGGSANGDFVFFVTAAALVPHDVDGELPLDSACATTKGCTFGHEYSLSSDVYEWRNNGVDGCASVQGCISLITTGNGGFLNVFLGADASGRDVFFATDESLYPGDDDTASDIYDARIDGGFTAPAPRPAECEGDSCSSPLGAPNDLTPASATFQGAGNLVSEPSKKPAGKSKKKTRKKVTKRKPSARKKSKRKPRRAKQSLARSKR